MENTQSEIKKNQFLKILIPMIIFLSIIYLVQSGYKTGQLLYDFIHN